MTVSSEKFRLAAANYAILGVDVEAALNTLAGIPISIHCWQGDDVIGFDGAGAVSGGIQATGNYPGRARNFAQLKQDIETALHLLPGKHRLNLHASYAVFEPGQKVDRDQLKPEHFQPVLDWWNDRQEITEDGFDKSKTFTVQQLTEELGYNLDQCGYPHEEEEILAPMDLIQRYEEQRASLNAEIDRVLEQITNLLGGNAE